MPEVRDAQRDATDLLDRAWVHDGKITIPIDPAVIAQRIGVEVRQATLDPDVSGAVVKDVGADPVIYLARSDSPNRQRFTCAHELGHVIAREADAEFAYVDRRDSMSSTGAVAAERYANAFAAQLLMPDFGVRQLHDEGATVAGLAAQFGVSVEAMGIRLRKLRLKTRQ